MREREFKQAIVDEFLAFVEDPRVERTRKHSLETILVISLMAVICGADGFVAIERFAIATERWLAEFLDLSGGVPSHDTIGRLFAALNPKSLAEAFRRWTTSIASATAEKVVAIDGKTLRRSFRQAGDNAFVHMVSAWSHANRVVLGQVKTEDKSNEITAIPALLDLIDVTGRRPRSRQRSSKKAATTFSLSKATNRNCTTRSSSTSWARSARTLAWVSGKATRGSLRMAAGNFAARGSVVTWKRYRQQSAGRD
jgi:hypothetical protein